ncbi:MAG: mechanosensitive ion channel [Candidatus Woesearchaeota archaeon]
MVNNSIVSSAEITETVSLVNPIFLNVLNALVILFLGFIIGRILRSVILRIFEFADLDAFLRNKFKIKRASYILSKIVEIIIYLITIILVLIKINLATTIITTIIIILIVFLTLFFIFGLNDIIANFFSGVLFRMKKTISVGDRIKIRQKNRLIIGTISDITMLEIKIKTEREELIIPNTLLARSIVTKMKKTT